MSYSSRNTGAPLLQRQSTLQEFGPQGSGFDPSVYYVTRPTQVSQPGQAHRAVSHSAERPVLLAQLTAMGPSNAAYLDGVELGQVTVVGRVLHVVTTHPAGAACHALLITDSTGIALAQQWGSPADTAQPPVSSAPQVGEFVRVSGRAHCPADPLTAAVRPTSMPDFGQLWRVTGLITPLHDANEITHHTLFALLTTLRLCHGDVPPAPLKPASSNIAPHRPKAAAAPIVARPYSAPAAGPLSHDSIRYLRLPSDAIAAALNAADPDVGLTRPQLIEAAAALWLRSSHCSSGGTDSIGLAVDAMIAALDLVGSIDDEHFILAAAS